MTFRPGSNAVLAAGGLLLLACLGFFLPVIWWGFGLGALLLTALFIIDLRAVREEIQSVQVSRKLPQAVGRGHEFTMQLNFRREAAQETARDWSVTFHMPCPVVCAVREWEETILWGQAAETVVATSLSIPIRGKQEFGSVWLRLPGPWKLAEIQREFPLRDAVKVLPETYFTGERLLQDAASQMELLDKVLRERQRGVGTEFESLNEFREGDDPRRIDWRTSVRHQRLVVRRFQIERHRDVMIVLDCGRLMAASHRSMTKLDAAVDAGLILSRVALEGGDRCGFGLFDQQVQGFVPPQAGPGAMRRIQEQVYDVQSRWGESDFSQMFATLQARQPKRCLMIIISDLLDAETTNRFRAALLQLSQRHMVLFAALKTPLLHEVLQRVPQSVQESWETALAFRLLKEREQALYSLRRAGVHVLDVLPEHIGPKLINEFLELRSRNLL